MFMFFIRCIYWLQLFACPVILFALIAFWVYSKGEQNKTIALILLIAGGIVGTVFAEYIRRRFGLEKFFSGLFSNNPWKKKKD